MMIKGLIRNTATALTLLLMLVGTLSSCRDDLAVQSGGSQDSGQSGTVTINFAVSDAAMPGTRADGSGEIYEEKFTDDLWVLVFKKDEQNPSDETKRYYMARRVTKSTSEEGMYKIELPIQIFQEDLTFLFVANSSSIWNDSKTQHPDDVFIENPPQTSYNRGYTLNECLRKVLVMELDDNAMSGEHHGILQQLPNGLPMFCIKTWQGLGEGQFPDNLPMQLGKVELLRSAVRIDVGIKYQDVTSQDGTSSATAQGVDYFKMTNVYVANTNDAIGVGPFDMPDSKEYADYANIAIKASSVSKASGTNPWTISKVSVPDAATKTTSRIYAYDEKDEKAGNAIEQRLYVPEQANSGNLTTTIDPSKYATERPYLIIKGYYGVDNINKYNNESTRSQAKASYYRLDFINTASGDNSLFDLKRGNLVRMNITDVKGPGFDTPEEAANSLAQNMTVETTVWDIMNSNVAFDGQSFISAERMAVDMPRDKDVSFRLLMDKSEDIDWTNDVKIGYESSATTTSSPVFPSDQTKAISIPYPGGSESDPLFTATKSSLNGKYYITITTSKAYASGVQPAYLLVKAKRITLKITLTQKDISTSDWERGNNQSLDLDGSPVSSRFIYFPGGGDEQELIVKPSTTENTLMEFTTDPTDTISGIVSEEHKATWVSIKGKAGDIGTDKDMVSVTLVAKPNTTDNSRVCYGILTYGKQDAATGGATRAESGSDWKKKAVITISQTALTRADVSSLSYGFKWRDRTSGTNSNSLDDQQKAPLYTYEEAKLSCPYGWGLPDASDFTNLKGSSSSSAFDGGISFAKVADDAAMLYTTYTRQYLKTGTYWTQDGKYVSFSMANKNVGDQLGWEDVIISPSTKAVTPGEKHYARCIRKFRLDSNTATLNMAGEAVYVNYTTLNTSDDFEKISISGSNPTDIKVTRDGANNRIVITADKANWDTEKPVTATFKLKMNDGSETSKNYQTLTITQGKRPAATKENEFISINGIDWDFRNLGATDNESKYYYVYMGAGDYPNIQRGISVQQVYADFVINELGNGAGILTSDMSGNTNPNSVENYYTHFGKVYNISEADPCTTERGSEWRLPSISEWKDLFDRLHIYEQSFKKTINNPVKNNDKTFPIYYITDGNSITYLPIGISYLNNSIATLQNSHTYYATSDAYRGTNRYVLGLNRIQYRYDKDSKVKVEWSNFVNNFNAAPPYTITQRTVSAAILVPVRCVKASQTKAK